MKLKLIPPYVQIITRARHFFFYKIHSFSHPGNKISSAFHYLWAFLCCLLKSLTVSWLLGVSFCLRKNWEKRTKLSLSNLYFLPLLGKNAYALSVLRRIEMKLDGRDVGDNRYLLSLELFNRFWVIILINSSPLLDFQGY